MGKIDINLWMDDFKAKLKEGQIAKEDLYKSLIDVADQYIIQKMKEYGVSTFNVFQFNRAIGLSPVEKISVRIDNGNTWKDLKTVSDITYEEGKLQCIVKNNGDEHTEEFDKSIITELPNWFFKDLVKNDDWFILSRMHELKDSNTAYNGLLDLCSPDEKLIFCVKLSNSDKQEKRVMNAIIKQSQNCFGFSYGRAIGAFMNVAPHLEWTGVKYVNGYKEWDEANYVLPPIVNTSIEFKKTKSSDFKFNFGEISIDLIANYLNNVSTIFPSAKLDFAIIAKDAVFVSNIKDMTGKYLLCTKRRYTHRGTEYESNENLSFNSEQEAIDYLCKGEHEIKSLSLDALKTIDSGYEFVSFIPYRQIELK